MEFQCLGVENEKRYQAHRLDSWVLRGIYHFGSFYHRAVLFCDALVRFIFDLDLCLQKKRFVVLEDGYHEKFTYSIDFIKCDADSRKHSFKSNKYY